MLSTEKPDHIRTKQRYSHEAFLKKSSFAKYKELILREVSQQQQSQDSTSAESPSRHGERDTKRGEMQSEDHSLENNSVESELVSPIKPRSFKEKDSVAKAGSSSNSPTKRMKSKKANLAGAAKGTAAAGNSKTANVQGPGVALSPVN